MNFFKIPPTYELTLRFTSEIEKEKEKEIRERRNQRKPFRRGPNETVL